MLQVPKKVCDHEWSGNALEMEFREQVNYDQFNLLYIVICSDVSGGQPSESPCIWVYTPALLTARDAV